MEVSSVPAMPQGISTTAGAAHVIVTCFLDQHLQLRMAFPLLSICIVTKNCVHDLCETLKTLPALSDAVNVVAVDGNSTDGTFELLTSYSSNYFNIYREPGTGIYRAMNIALQNANGRYIYFLNAGDLLLSDNIPLDYLSASSNTQILLMNTLIDSIRLSGLDIPKSRFYFIKKTLCHQAVFVPLALYHKFNYFDLKYKCRADFDFFLKSFHFVSYKVVPHTIAHVSSVGFSSRNIPLYLIETRKILTTHLGYPVIIFLSFYRIMMRLFRPFVLK